MFRHVIMSCHVTHTLFHPLCLRSECAPSQRDGPMSDSLSSKTAEVDEAIRSMEDSVLLPPRNPVAALATAEPTDPVIPQDPTNIFCPLCGAEMRVGRISIHPSALGWLAGLFLGGSARFKRTARMKNWSSVTVPTPGAHAIAAAA